MTLRLVTSMTETSFDTPLVVRRYFSSGVNAVCQTRCPTRRYFCTAWVSALITAMRLAGPSATNPPEQEIEHPDHRDVDKQCHHGERDGVAPGLCDLVARLRQNLDRADALAVDNHGHIAARDRRRDQCGEPRWCSPARREIGAAGGCAHRQRTFRGVLHHDPDVTDEPQWRGEVSEKFFCWHFLLHEGNRFAYEQLRELH